MTCTIWIHLVRLTTTTKRNASDGALCRLPTPLGHPTIWAQQRFWTQIRLIIPNSGCDLELGDFEVPGVEDLRVNLSISDHQW